MDVDEACADLNRMGDLMASAGETESAEKFYATALLIADLDRDLHLVMEVANGLADDMSRLMDMFARTRNLGVADMAELKFLSGDDDDTDERACDSWGMTSRRYEGDD
jgi:hypothetical protein